MLCNTEFESLGSDFVSICLCVMSLCVMSHVSLCLSSLMSPVSMSLMLVCHSVSHVSHVSGAVLVLIQNNT